MFLRLVEPPEILWALKELEDTPDGLENYHKNGSEQGVPEGVSNTTNKIPVEQSG